MGDASLSESPEEEEDIDSPGPQRGNCSPPALSEPFSPSADDWLESPRKRTQTLPTFNCPLIGMAAKADALNRWSRIQETDERTGTLSEDIFRILDLRTSGSLFGGCQTNKNEGEDRFTDRRGSDNTGSSTAGLGKPDSSPKVVLVPPPPLQSERALTLSPVAQQLNNRPEKKDEQQLDR